MSSWRYRAGRPRRWKTAAAAMAFVFLAACGGGDDDASSTSSTVPSTTSSAPGSDAKTTTTAGSTTTTGGRPGTGPTARPSTATTAEPSAPSTPGEPAVLAPAAPGTYLYGTKGTVSFGNSVVPLPAVTSLVVAPPAGTRQSSTRSLKDTNGNGPVTEIVVDYRPQGVFLGEITLTTSFSGFSDVRTLRPQGSALILPTGAGPGTHQELALSGSGITADTVVDVLPGETVYVGGQAVNAIVVRLATTLRPGDLTGKMELTLWLSPEHRLWVKERAATDANAGLIRFQSQYEAVLQRLTPS